MAHRTIEAQSVTNPAAQAVERVSGPGGSQIDGEARSPISLMLVGIMDGGGPDRYGVIVLRGGDWLLENINWVDRSGTDAESVLLAGRQLHISQGFDLTILAGPWYEYANHAWDEAVVDTNVEFQRKRFHCISTNHWGIALKGTGGFFDSHILSVNGMPGLPGWLGASAQVKHSTSGLERLWAGPMFTKRKGGVSFSGVPYWDILRRTVGLRLTVSYQVAHATPRSQN